MKKTLVALAVLAASGASFAQATITGSYAGGYETRTTAGTRVGGIGTDTAAIAVSASEDLGGGMKASAKVSLGGMNRDGGGNGEDAHVKLEGGFGAITIATYETTGSAIYAKAMAGAPGYDLQGRVFDSNSNIDSIIWDSVRMSSGLGFQVSYSDRGTGDGSTATPGTAGLNAGHEGSASGQPSVGLRASYVSGPIDAYIDYTSWMRKEDPQVDGGGTNDSRVRLAGTYDLGMAKVGLGFADTRKVNGSNVREAALGVSAKFGATTVGATYGTNKNNTEPVTTDNKGWTVGVQYDLSKRTNVGASYMKYENLTSTDNSGFRLFLAHSF